MLGGGFECLTCMGVCIDHMPSQAPILVTYQHIIASKNTLDPLESWLDYVVQF